METLNDGAKKINKLISLNYMINTEEMVVIDYSKKLQYKNSEYGKLVEEARFYLSSYKWCREIKRQWLALNCENLLTVFLFEIIPNSQNADDYVWVVVGDLPSAYIDIESARDKKQVVKTYTEIMGDWVHVVKKSGNIEDCYPLNVPPTKEYAEMLSIRIKLIRENILPSLT